MRQLALILLLVLAACSGDKAPVPAKAHAAATASTTVGGVTLQTSTVALADLNDAVATRYGIDRSTDGIMLLVTVRDAAGNGIDPGDLQLVVTASALPDPPTPLALRAIQTDGMTDYLGVVNAKAPATVTFKLIATRGGARSDIATTAELQPR
ncbi:DUF4426 domain-containing protein [Thermomonas carbonis]|uniref:DUF4426 domain-containing protein n=1 Tax=Thermomonas carbonis TaxID=1463158 RepID=A0A7G9SR74_9GAMM|nr:DUF4426 domain-containing protein [Thermomonas carbonis]QNN70349.1 DUF4426 domain-containing protein [Thermomonas carbonis]GHB99415.1 hypothetical protein GCM10010080_10290 [Thermomonas carbonis]